MPGAYHPLGRAGKARHPPDLVPEDDLGVLGRGTSQGEIYLAGVHLTLQDEPSAPREPGTVL